MHFKKSKYFIGGVESNNLAKIVEYLLEQDKEFGTLVEVCRAVLKEYKKINDNVNVKNLRLAHSITQEQLAKRLSVSQVYISQVETNKKSLSTALSKKIKDMLFEPSF